MSTTLSVYQELANCKPNFMSVLSNKSLRFESEAEFATQILMGNDTLMSYAESNRSSLINAIMNVAAIGISLNPASKQAYLIPRKGKVCLDISYKGLVDLATAGGSILWAQAQIVYANDIYQSVGICLPPKHEYPTYTPITERGPIVGAYAVAKLPCGDYITVTMTIDEIFAIRERSDSVIAVRNKKIYASCCPWFTDEGEMIKKTVIKRASKTWPKSAPLQAAINYLDTEGEEGISFAPVMESDLLDLINAARATKTDEEALKFWKANNGKLAKRPTDHAAFKAAVAEHRTNLRAAEENRTIDMPTTSAPASNDIPDILKEFVIELESAAQSGIQKLEEAYSSFSKTTQDKLAPYYTAIFNQTQKVAA